MFASITLSFASRRFPLRTLVLLPLVSWASPVMAVTLTDIGAGLPGLFRSSMAWGDSDNDGDLDLLLAGENNSGVKITRVFRNTRAGCSRTPVRDCLGWRGQYPEVISMATATPICCWPAGPDRCACASSIEMTAERSCFTRR